MNRDHIIIMYGEASVLSNPKCARCFACIGRDTSDNLCSDNYLRDINSSYTFQCGVNGYNSGAVRKSNIEHFDNKKHKILMTTNQCFLCDKKCKYSDILCDEIYKTVKKYKEVVGII